jgi:hypothetical protein
VPDIGDVSGLSIFGYPFGNLVVKNIWIQTVSLGATYDLWNIKSIWGNNGTLLSRCGKCVSS